MINLKRAMKSNRILKALTGLKRKGFLILAVRFGRNIEEVFKRERNINIHLGRPYTLRMAEEKLFFILFYMKCYPTFDVAGFIFNVDRASCCRWVHWFLPVLIKTLEKECVLPVRKISSPEEFVELFPGEKDIFIDGTERPRRRPKDPEKQKNHYSGKKKRHTIKNIVGSDKKKRILMVSETVEGKTHDYKMFKESEMPEGIPDWVLAWVDNGFQGIENDFPDLKVRMPKRKPKGGELSEKEKAKNKKISKKRILSEHAIGGIKRLRAVTDIYRNVKKDFEDDLMIAASGIWNYYLKTA